MAISRKARLDTLKDVLSYQQLKWYLIGNIVGLSLSLKDEDKNIKDIAREIECCAKELSFLVVDNTTTA